MGPLRVIAVVTILSASFQVAAADAARCAELQANLRKLDSYIAGSPTASDRQRFVEARTAQAKLLPYACGSGAGASAGSLPRVPGSTALPGVINGIIGALPPPGAYQVPEPPAGPPAPPTPSESVEGPMTLQRLPGGAAPAMQPLEQHAASGFPTDEQIASGCADSPNPSSCALVRESQRNQDPAYRRWKAEEAALQQRNIDKSLANIDTAIAAQRDTAGRTVIPVSRGPMPFDNSDPDLAKCREGSKDPWTIAGCYDLSRWPRQRRRPSRERTCATSCAAHCPTPTAPRIRPAGRPGISPMSRSRSPNGSSARKRGSL